MKELNLDGKDKTIKKLLESNKLLRDDLKREEERFNLLEKKYKELLIKYNVVAKEHATNVEKMFSMNTGGQMQNYSKILSMKNDVAEEDDNEIRNRRSLSGKKKKSFGRDDSFERRFEDVY